MELFVNITLGLSLTLMMPISASIMICYQRQRRRRELLGMRPSAVVKHCPYVVPSLNYVPPETPGAFKLQKPNKRPPRRRKSGKRLATGNTEQCASEDGPHHRRRSSLYTHTTVSTDMGSRDKQLTFEQCQTDVGPRLNLVEDIVDNRKTASQQPINEEHEDEMEEEEKQQRSNGMMPSSHPVSSRKVSSRQSKKNLNDKQGSSKQGSSPKRKHKEVRQPTRSKYEETDGKDHTTRGNRHKRHSSETEGKACFVSEGTFY